MEESSQQSFENQLHRTVSVRSVRYNKKRCGCKFTANSLQNDKMQQDKLHQQKNQQQQQHQQQQKQCRYPDNYKTYKNNTGHSVRQLVVFCCRQKRAHAVVATMTPADSLAATLTEQTTTVITAVATTTRCISIVCNCDNPGTSTNSNTTGNTTSNTNSKTSCNTNSNTNNNQPITNSNTKNNTKNNSSSKAIPSPITSTSGHQRSTTATSTVDLRALSVAKYKISMISSSQSTAIYTNSDCCDYCAKQHGEILETAGDTMTTSATRTATTATTQTATTTTTPPDDSAKNRLALLLLLVWLLCLFLILSFIAFVYAAIAAVLRCIQRRSHAKLIIDHRKCNSLLFCILLCAQTSPLAHGSLTDGGPPRQGSSAASLGLQLALGTLTTVKNPLSSTHSTNELRKDGDNTRLVPAVADFEVRLPSAPTSLLIDGGRIVNFISRDNLLERAQGRDTEEPGSTSSHYSCRSCQMREKAKLDNLESIKKHILMRLQLSKLPNITTPIQVPHKIIENFYKNFSGDSNGKRRNSRGKSAMNPASTEAVSVARKRAHDRHYLADAETEEDMQGDDPHVYAARSSRHQEVGARDGWTSTWEGDSSSEKLEQEQNYIFDEGDEDDFEEEFYSHINSVYVFPKTPRLRHNRKLEILNFRLDNSYTAISHVIVHVYIRGREWMREHDPSMLLEPEDLDLAERRRYVVVTVHRAVRRKTANSTSITHTAKLSETRHRIPSGLGQWVQIEVQQLASFWSSSRNSTQSLVIKGLDLWMRPFIVTGADDASLSVFVEVFTKRERRSRQKRSTSLDCSESDNEMRCCRYPLSVNFTNFGWNWVIAPTSFNAYFCNGECKLGFLEKNTHTHLTSLSTSAQPCCSPTKMSPLKLLYFNSEQSLVLSTIPNMSVDKCSCS